MYDIYIYNYNYIYIQLYNYIYIQSDIYIYNKNKWAWFNSQKCLVPDDFSKSKPQTILVRSTTRTVPNSVSSSWMRFRGLDKGIYLYIYNYYYYIYMILYIYILCILVLSCIHHRNQLLILRAKTKCFLDQLCDDFGMGQVFSVQKELGLILWRGSQTIQSPSHTSGKLT
jgi:hypothetical protein